MASVCRRRVRGCAGEKSLKRLRCHDAVFHEERFLIITKKLQIVYNISQVQSRGLGELLSSG